MAKNKILPKIEIAVAITAVLVLTLILTKPNITGFVSSQARTQQLDLYIDQSHSYILKTSDGAPLKISSFSITGNIEGDGTVSVFLSNREGTKLKVFSNTGSSGTSMEKVTGSANKITGMAAGIDAGDAQNSQVLVMEPGQVLTQYDQPTGEISNGAFENECLETCLLPIDLFDENSYEITFLVQPGTALLLSQIVYTAVEE